LGQALLLFGPRVSLGMENGGDPGSNPGGSICLLWHNHGV